MQRQTQSSFLIVAAIAGGIAFVAFVAMLVLGGLTVSPAFFLAILIGLAAAIALFLGFHRGPDAHPADLRASTDGKLGDVTREPGTAGRSTIAGLPDDGRGTGPTGSPAATATGASAAGATAGTADASATPAPDPTPAPTPAHGGSQDGVEPRAPAPDADDAGAPQGDDARAASPAGVSGDAAPLSADPVAADDDQSAHPGAPDGSRPASGGTDAPTGDGMAPDPAADKAGAPHPGDGDDPAAAPGAPGPAPVAGAEVGTEPRWKSSQLMGSDELASRKGSWRYDRDGAASGAVAGQDAMGGEPAPVSSDPSAPPAGAGKEPERMESAREGGPDDLKKIKGVGPKLESMLHGLGFYHFDQVANWTDEEVAWVDQHLEGFNGRVRRDEWVSQAKILAAGGETEFSSRS